MLVHIQGKAEIFFSIYTSKMETVDRQEMQIVWWKLRFSIKSTSYPLGKELQIGKDFFSQTAKKLDTQSTKTTMISNFVINRKEWLFMHIILVPLLKS